MLISLWFVWVFAAQLPYLPGRLASTVPPPDTLEGSGMGGDFEGLDLSAFYDEEDDYDDDYDDGEGDFYDDYPTNFDDVIFETHVKSTENTPTTSTKVKTITCFRCLGDGTTGCDVTSMVKDLEKFTVTCVGKCLNITAGPISVFDCARDLATKTSMCLNDFNTNMCFCDTNLCNGPVHLTDPSMIEMDFPFPLPTRHHDVSDININGGESDYKNITTLDAKNDVFDHNENKKLQVNNPEGEESLPINDNSSSISSVLFSKTDDRVLTSKPTNHSEESRQNRTSNTIPINKNDKTPSVTVDGGFVSPNYFTEAEVDVVISSKSGKTAVGGNNSSSDEANKVNLVPPEEVHLLSVASLQDGGRGNSICVRYDVLVQAMAICLQFVLVGWRSVL